MKNLLLFIVAFQGCSAFAEATVVKIYGSKTLLIQGSDLEQCCEKGQAVYISTADDSTKVEAKVKRVLKNNRFIVKPKTKTTAFTKGDEIKLTSLSTGDMAVSSKGGYAPTDNSSRANRDRKPFGLSARAGMVLGGFAGAGAELVASPTSSIDAALTAYRTDEDLTTTLLADEPYLETARIQATQVFLKSRFFLGNSFYVAPGLGYRKVDVDFGFNSFETIRTSGGDSGDLQLQADISTSSTAFVGNLTLGNVWTFGSGFFIGADWVGYSQPISGSWQSNSSSGASIDNESVSFDDEASNDLQDIANRLAEDMATVGDAQLLILNIGFRI